MINNGVVSEIDRSLTKRKHQMTQSMVQNSVFFLLT